MGWSLARLGDGETSGQDSSGFLIGKDDWMPVGDGVRNAEDEVGRLMGYGAQLDDPFCYLAW